MQLKMTAIGRSSLNTIQNSWQTPAHPKRLSLIQNFDSIQTNSIKNGFMKQKALDVGGTQKTKLSPVDDTRNV